MSVGGRLPDRGLLVVTIYLFIYLFTVVRFLTPTMPLTSLFRSSETGPPHTVTIGCG